MAWAKVDDKLHTSVKWRRASKGGRALWTTALSWCSDQENGGHVPADMLRVLDGTPAEAKSLVNAGLWNVVSDGWEFHNWSVYNPDSATLKAKRDAESRGGKLGNHMRWHVKQGVTVPDCEFCATSSDTQSGNETVTGHRKSPNNTPASPAPKHDNTPEKTPTLPPAEPITAGQTTYTPSGTRSAPDQAAESGANPPDPTRPDPTQKTTNKNQRGASGADAATTPTIEHQVTDAAYQRLGKGFNFIATRAITRWAIHDKKAAPQAVYDALIAVYEMGKPITKQTIGQYLDGHIRTTTANRPLDRQAEILRREMEAAQTADATLLEIEQ